MAPVTISRRAVLAELGSRTGSPVTGPEQQVLGSLVESARTSEEALSICESVVRNLRLYVPLSRLQPSHSKQKRRGSGARGKVSTTLEDRLFSVFTELNIQARYLARRYAEWSEEEMAWFLVGSLWGTHRTGHISPRNLNVVRYVEALTAKNGPPDDWEAQGLTWKILMRWFSSAVKHEWRYLEWRNFRRDYYDSKKRLEGIAEAAYQKEGLQGPKSLPAMRRRWGRWPSSGNAGDRPHGRSEVEEIRRMIQEILQQGG